MCNERDRSIVAAYQAGAAQSELADTFGLSQPRISNIIRREGAQGNWRKRISAQMRRAYATGKRQRLGRPRLDISADDRALYEKVRRHFGAVEAKRIMGLDA
ncbi:MAG: hypothetical protein HKN38_06130 [Altererythrobacter sp.]|nr:hypothetical protein [Altererythrobacter sp.]